MPSLRSSLAVVAVGVIVAATLSQSAGAQKAGAPPLELNSLSRLAVTGRPVGAHQTPVYTSIGKAVRAATAPRGVLGTLSTTAPTFVPTGAPLGSDTVFSATWADYDADGRLDLLTMGINGTWPSAVAFTHLYRNNGDGTFTEDTASGLPAVWEGSASWTDYDSDDYPDVLIWGCFDNPCTSIETRLYHNNGDGTFTEDTRANLPGVAPDLDNATVSWADYDGDGRPDLLLSGVGFLVVDGLTEQSLPTGGTALYHNNGDGTFTKDTQAGFPDLLFGVSAWADYDSDGRPDVLITGETWSDAAPATQITKLFHNDGGGVFSEDTAADLSALEGGWIAWGDYDNDGRPDIVVNGVSSTGAPDASGATVLYHNNGNGSFTVDTAAGLPAESGAQLLWGDFNGDGRLDLALNACTGTCTGNTDWLTDVYDNNGDGTFTRDPNVGLPNGYLWLVTTDYNSDGRLDLLVYEQANGKNASIYQNNSPVAAAPSPPSELEAHFVKGHSVVFTWNASSSHTSDTALTYNLSIGRYGQPFAVSPMAVSSGARELVGFGNEEGKTSATISNLSPGSYWWTVQTVGPNFAGSSFASNQSFTIDPEATIALSGARIDPCSSGAGTIAVTGNVSPSLYSATVVLQSRHARGGGWKAFRKQPLSSSGTFAYAKVGTGARRSFWLRARIRSRLTTVVSAPKHVTVASATACKAKAKK